MTYATEKTVRQFYDPGSIFADFLSHKLCGRFAISMSNFFHFFEYIFLNFHSNIWALSTSAAIYAVFDYILLQSRCPFNKQIQSLTISVSTGIPGDMMLAFKIEKGLFDVESF